jgi:hypothetical protein
MKSVLYRPVSIAEQMSRDQIPAYASSQTLGAHSSSAQRDHQRLAPASTAVPAGSFQEAFKVRGRPASTLPISLLGSLTVIVSRCI